MIKSKKSITRKAAEIGGWNIARRVSKSIPYVGTVMAIGMVGYDVKRKGLLKGLINSGLDAIPFVGLAKNAIEFLTGDLLPDREESNSKPSGNKSSGTNTNDTAL